MLGSSLCTYMCVYLFHSDSEHESVTGFEHLDCILVGNIQQALPIHIQDLITNLHILEMGYCYRVDLAHTVQ